MCYFSLPDLNKKPLDVSEDLGIMLYDVFDIKNNIPIDTSLGKKNTSGKTQVSFFHAILNHGSIYIPEYESREILRGEAG